MKFLVFLCFIIFDQNAYSNIEKRLIKKSQVGKIKLDDNIESIYSAYKFENTKLKDLFLEGSFNPAMIVYKSKSKKAKVLMARFSTRSNKYSYFIDSLTVFDPDYKTKEGIGVGDLTKDVIKKLNIKEIDSFHGQVFLISKKKQMSFIVDNETLSNNNSTNINDKYLLKSKIGAILIYKKN